MQSVEIDTADDVPNERALKFNTTTTDPSAIVSINHGSSSFHLSTLAAARVCFCAKMLEFRRDDDSSIIGLKYTEEGMLS
jgi:formate hydrogenlyase subunit 4